METSNRSNSADRPVRVITVYADGHVSHRDVTKGRAPWNTGTGWGRAGAHALPSESPSAPAEVGPSGRVKDPRKVAAGKARAAQAKARKEAAANGQPIPAAPKPKAAKAPAKKAAPKGKAKAAKKAAAKPKAPPSKDAMVVVAFRVPRELKRKLEKLGGGAFLRKRIEAATIPAKG